MAAETRCLSRLSIAATHVSNRTNRSAMIRHRIRTGGPGTTGHLCRPQGLCVCVWTPLVSSGGLKVRGDSCSRAHVAPALLNSHLERRAGGLDATPASTGTKRTGTVLILTAHQKQRSPVRRRSSDCSWVFFFEQDEKKKKKKKTCLILIN